MEPSVKCSNCRSNVEVRTDLIKGERFCLVCGLVLDEFIPEEETELLSSQTEVGSKSGEPEMPEGAARGMAREGRIERKKQGPEILAEEKIEATIWKILEGSRPKLKEDSMDIFKKFWRGRGGKYSIDGVAVGCLYVAFYRQVDKSKSVIDNAKFIEQTPRKSKKLFEKLIERIRENPNIKIDEETSDDFDPDEYLQHYIGAFKLIKPLSKELKERTQKIYNAAKKRGFYYCRNPQDVLVASLYLAVKQNDLNILKKTIAEVTGRKVGSSSLNELPKEIEKLCGITI